MIVWKSQIFNETTCTGVSVMTLPLATNLAGYKCHVDFDAKIREDHIIYPLIATEDEKKSAFTVYQHKFPVAAEVADSYFINPDFDLPRPFLKNLEKSKLTMVFSEFQRDMLERSGVENVHVVRMPITPNFTVEGKNLEFVGPKGAGMIFGSVFTWTPEKTPELMWQAFMEEFPRDKYPDVIFISKMGLPYGFGGWSDIYKRYSDDRMFLIDRNVPKIDEFYRSIDCYCAPTSGEGWNATLLEAMACGIPCIASEYGGHRDFMNPKNSILVETEEWTNVKTESNYPKGLIPENALWKRPKIDSIRKAMRKMYTSKMAGTLEHYRGMGAIIQKNYSIAESAKDLKVALSSIL